MARKFWGGALTATVFAPIVRWIRSRRTRHDLAINIGVAGRALFNMTTEHEIYEKEGLEKYIEYNIQHENDFLKPGTAFPFIKALTHVNNCLRMIDKDELELFRPVYISHCHAQVGIRIIRSLRHHGLSIPQMCLTAGTGPLEYLDAYRIVLFLTSYAEEVSSALGKGFAAATLIDQEIDSPRENQLRVAFDMDAVLFSDEAEKVFKEGGLEAFNKHEEEKVDEPLPEGPLKEFAESLGKVQKKFQKRQEMFTENPIRTYIVTSRGASESGERALKTMRHWGLEIDEIFFLDGAPKGKILKAIKPHIFFDDQHRHVEVARNEKVPAAHVMQNNNN